MFCCKICKSEEYTEIMSSMYKCNGCSVMFADPTKFTDSSISTPDEPVEDPTNPHQPMFGKGLRFVRGTSSKPIGTVKDM